MSKAEKLDAIRLFIAPQPKAQIKVFIQGEAEPRSIFELDGESGFNIHVVDMETVEALRKLFNQGHEQKG